MYYNIPNLRSVFYVIFCSNPAFCPQVLLYSGQLDVIVAAPLTERFLQTVPWSRLEEYKKAERSVWKIRKTDAEVAGYVRVAGDFAQVRKGESQVKTV